MSQIEEDVDNLLRQYHSDTSPEAKKRGTASMRAMTESIKQGPNTPEALSALKRLEKELKPDRSVAPPVGTLAEAKAAAAAAGDTLSPETTATPPAPLTTSSRTSRK